MADYERTGADLPAVNLGASLVTSGPDWEAEDAYWQSAYPERPYARADRTYEYYRSAYRFGAQRAMAWRDREWTSAERDLERAWERLAEASSSAWADMKEAVRDAWDRVRGRSQDDRTHI